MHHSTAGVLSQAVADAHLVQSEPRNLKVKTLQRENRDRKVTDLAPEIKSRAIYNSLAHCDGKVITQRLDNANTG